jgi:general stress protein YciG
LTKNQQMKSEPLQQKSKRGFAAMSQERQREIASRAGKLAHKKGVAHEWNREEARKAGKKGGTISAQRRSINRVENDGCDHIL